MCCGPNENIQNEPHSIDPIYQYFPPIDLNDGLTVSDLDTEGLDDLLIRTMINSINASVYGSFRSLLIFKNDKLVFEEYFNGFDHEDLQPLWSVTKSISLAVIGISIDQGIIAGVNETIYNLMTGHPQVNWSEAHKQITLQHYLTMSAGYEWRDMDNGVPLTTPITLTFK